MPPLKARPIGSTHSFRANTTSCKARARPGGGLSPAPARMPAHRSPRHRRALRAPCAAARARAGQVVLSCAHRIRLGGDSITSAAGPRPTVRATAQTKRDYDALGRAADAGRPPVHRLPADATADDTRVPSRLVAPGGGRVWPAAHREAHREPPEAARDQKLAMREKIRA
jgi:hypothetical protein